ncbi:MAG: M28 family peptidase [Candidatus Hadarchaeum sp.]|nr:M28 family peptidase [Candidatus Hadarchaeum sp.]
MAEFEPRQAFEHIDKLAYEIGPRLAGTRGEQQAADYIQKQLESYGYKVEAQEFDFVDRAARMKTDACLLVAAFIVTLFLPDLIALAVFLIALAMFSSLPKLMPKQKSKNIIATFKQENPKKHLIITAHYDSARCVVNYKLQVFTKLALIPFISVALVFLLVRAAGVLPISWWPIWLILAFIFLPVCGSMFWAARSKQVSSGANDNASGLSVMLEVARVTRELQPSSEVTFVAFGAEEQGLAGSRAFVEKQKFEGENLVLNLDMVGAGKQVFVVEGNGLVRKHRTSKKLNEVLIKCCEHVGLKPKLWWAALAGHDHIPFLRAKLPATTFTLDSLGTDKLEPRLGKIFGLSNTRGRGYRYIHTMEDMPEKIELANIELAGKVVLELIKTV